MVRPAYGAFFALLFSIIPALATEEWECQFTSMSGSDKGLPGKGKIQVDGNAFIWLAPAPTATGWVKVPGRLLENTEVGIVASSSQAVIDKDVGDLVGASVTTLNKRTGEFRVGSVTPKGEHDLIAGSCKLK